MLFRRRQSAALTPQNSSSTRSSNATKYRTQDDTYSVNFFKWAASAQLAKLKGITLAHILSGDTCEPLSLAEFEAYLSFREHSLENLQFLVWYQSYRSRFFELPQEQQALSPGPKAYEFKMGAPSRAALDRKAFPQYTPANADNTPLTPPLNAYTSASTNKTAEGDDPQYLIVPDTPITPHADLSPPDPLLQPNVANYTRNAPPPLMTMFGSRTTDSTNMNPFSPPFPPSPAATPLTPGIQPFRDEALRIVATFLRPGAVKELALDEIVREAVLKNLVWNTHPDVFQPAYEAIYDIVEHHSVPAFLLHASANINLPKQIFWYWIGTLHIIMSILIALSLILMIEVPPQTKRAYRLFAVPFTWMGSMQFYSATRGFCTQVFGRDAVQLRSWEIQEVDEEAAEYWSKVKGNDRVQTALAQHPPGLVSKPGKPNMAMLPLTESEKPKLIALDQLKPDVHRTTTSTSASTQGGNSSKFTTRSATSTSPLEEWGVEDTLNIDDPRSFTSAVTSNAKPAESDAGGATLPKLRYNWDDPWDSPEEEQPEYQDRPSSNGRSRKTMGEAVIDIRETRNGYRRPPIFGPEKVVRDPRIMALHKSILRQILLVGFAWTVLFTAVIMAVPSAHHLHRR
ncbi:hypothetical protein SISSUDRAFT_1049503 [Sistotremastrum suecicum HHB10207 ss-3]|uniref:RGS domain-containing protein n=1 Tax=Sistotremastrum suecicum HHB10207 ss-3 TaxID=1314776 RepID=A0A166BRR5_9AGAM|nr:hypothetical protein SISSUDRAFT_1049503 [Sistotremastrum suecicum HHB10207 ss-3]